MPLYEYQCASCGKSCEILQKMQEEPATLCPECGKAALKRKVSAPRFQLKGSGWYVTDFKNSPPSTETGAGSKAEESTPAAEAPKTDDPAKTTKKEES
jgi:putative FmdB family regulatory protein